MHNIQQPDMCYSELIKQPCIYRHAVAIDIGTTCASGRCCKQFCKMLLPSHEPFFVDRSFPEHEQFAEKGGQGQESLFNTMCAYSNADPEVGYCQGLSFVGGLILMHVRFYWS